MTYKIRKSRPEDLSTKKANVVYVEGAGCPAWERHVALMCRRKDGTRNVDKEQLLQRWCGYCMTGYTSEQRFLYLCGKARSGKSVFVETIAWMMGTYAVTLSKSVLTGDENAHPTNRMPLISARWARFAEEFDQDQIKEATLKGLVTSNTFTARGMRQDLRTYRSTAKFILEGNERFRIRERSGGIWRRMILVVIELELEDEEVQVLGYVEKLRAEGSGILNWCLAGHDAWQKGGLAVPAEMDADVDDYRADEDIIGQCVDDIFIRGEVPVWQSIRHIYEAYVAWCEANGHRPMSAQRLSNELVQRFDFERGGNNRRAPRSWGIGTTKMLLGPRLVTGVSSGAAYEVVTPSLPKEHY